MKTKKLLTVVILLCLFTPLGAEERIALVIGNGDYIHTSKLPNPANDAVDVADTLDDLGFEVTKALHLDTKSLSDTIQRYADSMKNPDAVGFFYFAGHAVQISGNNYLIPIDVDFSRAGELTEKGYDIRNLLNALSKTNNRMNFIVLDSCRNNPFSSMDTADLSRAIRRYAKNKNDSSVNASISANLSKDAGLGRMDAPINTLIAYSTKPGYVALDGDTRNSPYTAALIDMIQQEGVHISQVFADIRRVVFKDTDGKQMPWESSSLTETFVFKERRKAYATPY